MFRRLLPATALGGVLLLAPSAHAAQRHYRVTSGVTTITFDQRWLDTLGQADVQFGGVDGVRVTATRRRDGPPIIRASFKVRRARANSLVYVSGRGAFATVEHAGGLAFSSLSRPGTVAFRRPTLIVLGSRNAANRIDADLPYAGGENGLFAKPPSVRIGSPHGGEVRITMRDVTFAYSGWMVFGATPNDPPTDNPWFPRAAIDAVMGDTTTVLRVKRRR